MSIVEALYGLEIGKNIIEQLKKEGYKEPQLHKKNKTIYNEYEKHIKKYSKDGMKEEDIKNMEEAIEDELFYVQLFLLWIQEKYEIKRKKK
jgi:NTP pyrophosphatase (non-canonical NTP hydrolase)